MTTLLHPCPDCHRHVRTTESACPFCGVVLDATWASGAKALVRRVPAGARLSRAALFAAGALAIAPTACGGDTEDSDATGGAASGGAATGGADATGGVNGTPIYGIAPVGGAAGEPNAGGAGGESSGDGGTLPGPVYGLPPGQ